MDVEIEAPEKENKDSCIIYGTSETRKSDSSKHSFFLTRRHLLAVLPFYQIIFLSCDG
jgi:hypothetical protein